MMREINSDQDEILHQLFDIEKELDILIQEGLNGYSMSKSTEVLDFYNNPLYKKGSGSTGETLFYEQRVPRQQVFQKAFMIEQYVDEISNDLNNVQRTIDLTQKTTSGHTALKIPTEDGNQVVIDDILNSHYEALQQLENAAMGL